MSRNSAAIPFYFTPAAQAHLNRLRASSHSVYWHDKEIEDLIQMAVRFGLKYDLEESRDPGQGSP